MRYCLSLLGLCLLLGQYSRAADIGSPVPCQCGSACQCAVPVPVPTFTRVCGPNGCQLLPGSIATCQSCSAGIPATQVTPGCPSGNCGSAGAAAPRRPILHRIFHPFQR